MNAPPVPRRSSLLEAAAQRIKLAARAAVERTIESLGLAALATGNVYQRDGLLGAQFELNRKSAAFVLAFNESLDDRLLRDSGLRPSGAGLTSWDDLRLVDDDEVERKVAAERLGLALAHACEWELRELDAYMGSLLPGATERHPLQPDVIGLALLLGAEACSERPEIRSVLVAEIGRVLTAEMRGTYAAIVADLRKAGVQPAGLSVRSSAGDSSRHTTSQGALADAGDSGHGGRDSRRDTGRDSGRDSGRHSGHHRHLDSGPGPGSLSGAGPLGRPSGRGGGLDRPAMGQVDPRMMSLIRRLAHADLLPVGPASGGADAGYESGAALPNLIQAHREELRQAATGSLDHVVIDVIATLFEQILADPKVPPQMARQIARLQLPVLRAALGDPSFFSSRRHPVRRFVNRIASLAAAYDDFGDDDALQFLAQVRDLVQGIVDGDFEQIEVYEAQLAALEAFIADQARQAVSAQGDPARLLGDKETAQRLARAYAEQLQAELKDIEGPAFVRDFLTEIWSQVLVQSAQAHGPEHASFLRLRGIARELFMSVQPKGVPAQRKAFLAELPRLMQGLNEGMDLIGWPQAARKAFFGLLLPAHAESLKGQALRTLDYNLMARRVEGAFGTPLPRAEALPAPTGELPVLSDAVAEPQFSAEEAARIGLLAEDKVDWSAPLPAAPEAGPALTEVDINIDGLPPPEPVEPTQGRALADHVQIGFAYQMLLDGEWQKVKLAHVSPARSFFVFTRGRRHQQTISLTLRMLLRLCDTDRLRAFESAYLLERATARARRQLASLGGGASA